MQRRKCFYTFLSIYRKQKPEKLTIKKTYYLPSVGESQEMQQPQGLQFMAQEWSSIHENVSTMS